VRLSKRLLAIIKEGLDKSFSGANVYLFGSRTDDTKRGGDIDIAHLQFFVQILKHRNLIFAYTYNKDDIFCLVNSIWYDIAFENQISCIFIIEIYRFPKFIWHTC